MEKKLFDLTTKRRNREKERRKESKIGKGKRKGEITHQSKLKQIWVFGKSYLKIYVRSVTWDQQNFQQVRNEPKQQ